MASNEFSDELWRLYTETTYEVDRVAGASKLAIRVGPASPAVDSLLLEYGVETWAFMTAWNPASQPRPRPENETRNAELKAQLDSDGYPALEGRGIGPDPAWIPEESYLVLGIEREAAIAIAQSYGQHAIVFGRRGSRAELVACSPRAGEALQRESPD